MGTGIDDLHDTEPERYEALEVRDERPRIDLPGGDEPDKHRADGLVSSSGACAGSDRVVRLSEWGPAVGVVTHHLKE